ncbi:F-box domain, FBD domain, Leucine-rich repeat domain, L domain-like protein [Artemisia annua]|uniref:F-box domain, FBD domain, Leucine-rich repeat domain, L domain-like protein n=1 Tax=Artemisia annua TaxID=35608 RepID=A0A2U1NNW0_ARTAN|nr:F-box domain, FBD domain, Leucine-rich repeat domain, L domain-like protein [Artemisia annua]
MKKSKRQNIRVDRISELPDPVLHLILTCLHSTKEAVRTSALSTRWRYLWTSAPSIDIDISRGSKPLWASDSNKVKEIVYWVLANRTQDLDSFTLRSRDRCLDYDMLTIRRWIHIALMRKAKQIVLPPRYLESYQDSLKHQSMKKANQSKAPINDNNNIDHISSLPARILHMILSRLKSTQEVVRTSVLSSRWKYLWTSSPSLDIRGYRGKSYLSATAIDKNKFKEFVHWVLANRILDLDSFTLDCFDYCDMSTIGRWIYLLVMRKIRQLDLKFCDRDNGRVVVLPCCLVNCDSLEVLKLDLNWSFLSLSSFTGSRTLKVLKLDQVKLLDHELVRKFLVNCPLLEELSLIGCYIHNLDYLSISSPNLKTLRIKNMFDYGENISRERLMVLCPKLTFLEIGGYMTNHLSFDVKSLKKAVIKHEYLEQKYESAICKLFAQVSHVEYLSVNYFFVKSISSACKSFNCAEEGLPESLPKLKTLELTIDCYKMEVLIPILRCSPNLESLHLTFYKDITPEEYEAFVEELDEVETRRILIRHLKKVEFLEFNGEKETIAIARYLLEHGTSLEEMVFTWCNEVEYQKKSMELKLCKGQPQTSQVIDLPSCNQEGVIAVQPMAILDRKMVKKRNAAVVYGMIQWTNGSQDDASWENLEGLYAKFPAFDSHS